MDSFQDKTALVTGASSGIGLALAQELAKRGAHLILSARSGDKLDALAQEIRASGRKAAVFTADLSEPGSAKKLYDEIAAAGLQVDLLVNNAGYGRWGDFLSFDSGDYQRMIHLNINSLTELCYLAIPDMAGKGVRVMTLCPGATASNFAHVASENSSEELKNLNAKMEQSNNMGQTCEEVAIEGLGAFLRDKVCAITGRSNRMTMFLPRILSRKRSLKMVGDIFRRRTAN